MIFKRKTFLFSSSSRVCSYLVRRKEKMEERVREKEGGRLDRRKIRKEEREKKEEESGKGRE